MQSRQIQNCIHFAPTHPVRPRREKPLKVGGEVPHQVHLEEDLAHTPCDSVVSMMMTDEVHLTLQVLPRKGYVGFHLVHFEIARVHYLHQVHLGKCSP